jgi:glycosyltransferase involved in cell wall biosynthesis
MARVPGEEVAPILSVITPAYNAARFLEEALDSVAALNTPHEHIVIDGGSTDGTVALLKGRRDASLRWSSEPDRGLTHAVNKGLARASGPLIGWLNADDAYVSENVDRAVEALLREPSLDAVFGFTDIVDEDGRSIRRYRCGPFSWRRYLYLGDYLPTPTIIFRRVLLRRSRELDERYEYSADYDFYLRLLRDAKVRRLRLPLVRFRYHAGSKTGSAAEHQQSEALEIRLGYARNGTERWLMRAAARAKRIRDSVRPPWPELPEGG